MTTESTVKIGPVRLSYVHLEKPYAGVDGNQDPKYQVSIIVPKKEKAMISKIEAAIEAAKEKGKAKHFPNGIPKKLDISFRDGDTDKEDENYADSFYISAKSKKPVGVLDKDKQPVKDWSKIYSGMWAYVQLDFYAYSKPKTGIACGLLNVMKYRDDDTFGTQRESAEDAFADIDAADDADDFLNT